MGRKTRLLCWELKGGCTVQPPSLCHCLSARSDLNGTLGQGPNIVDLSLPTVVKNTAGSGAISVGNIDRFGNLRRSAF